MSLFLEKPIANRCVACFLAIVLSPICGFAQSSSQLSDWKGELADVPADGLFQHVANANGSNRGTLSPPPIPPSFEILAVADEEEHASDKDESLWSAAHFPEEREPLAYKIIESIPTLITKPEESVAKFFGLITHAEHDEPETELHEYPIGIQPLPERPPLIVELNEKFLAPGWLKQGIEIPTGAIWRPAFWVFGEYRTATQYFDNGSAEPIGEWANRLDLFGQLNLSGTERVVVGMRPLDRELASSRQFATWDFRNGDTINGFNADIQTLFFEGDFGEIFPYLDPYDTHWLDIGFSVGRMPLLAQQGLLMNESRLDAVTMTRNTVYGLGDLNLRMTGVYSWGYITRNSSTNPIQNTADSSSSMVALLTESDFRVRTVNADVVYVNSDDARFQDMLAFGLSSIRRWHGFENTYNTSLHVLGSIPTRDTTDYAQQGELLFSQTSWTPHHTEDLVWLNSFWAIDQFTSPTRDPLAGSPLAFTGILFGAAGVGRYGAPLGERTNNIAGASVAYQMFYDQTRQQIIWETGGFKETSGPARGALATGLRYQRAIGQHHILVLEGFVSKNEARNWGQGGRAEIRVKF